MNQTTAIEQSDFHPATSERRMATISERENSEWLRQVGY